MNRDQALFQHFGLNPNALYWGEVHEQYAERIRDAVESRRLLAVIGRFGSGKSMLVKQTLQALDRTEMVYVNNPDKERLRVGQVITALITKLSQENARRDMIARTHQLARIMGEKVVNEKREVVVVIENAHRMHANSLLALKDLRESAIYKGESPLFSCLLVGQEPLRSKVEKFGEVQYRTKSLELSERKGWMNYMERFRYLVAVYGDVIEDDTRNRLALMFDSPLELDYFIEEKLELMRDAGIHVMSQHQVPLSLREQREAAKISLREVEEKSKELGARVAKSTISDVEHGKNNDPETKAQVENALDELLEEKKQGDLRRTG